MSAEELDASLLHAAPEDPPPPEWGTFRSWVKTQLWVYSSLFIVYHLFVLIVWNTPGKAIAKDWRKDVFDMTQGPEYFRGTSNGQSWAMFAPNPNRTNTFMRVLVEDQEGQIWDLEHDIWGKDRHPYVFYDRMGKINRRINKKKGYQRVYGAWVCREWEFEHGELPKEVRFIRKWTTVPEPHKVPAQAAEGRRFGYDPWKLPAKEDQQNVIKCANTPHGQLPPALRERHGLEPAEEGHFREVRVDTWYTKAEREREREERARERDKLLEERRQQAKLNGGPRAQK